MVYRTERKKLKGFVKDVTKRFLTVLTSKVSLAFQKSMVGRDICLSRESEACISREMAAGKL